MLLAIALIKSESSFNINFPKQIFIKRQTGAKLEYFNKNIDRTSREKCSCKNKRMHKLPSLLTLILIKRDILILILFATDLGQIFF